MLHDSVPLFGSTIRMDTKAPWSLCSPRPRRPRSASANCSTIALERRPSFLARTDTSRDLARLMGGMTLEAAPAPPPTKTWSLDVGVAIVSLVATVSSTVVKHVKITDIKVKKAAWRGFVPRIHSIVTKTLARWRPSSIHGMCTLAQGATFHNWLQSEVLTSLKSSMTAPPTKRDVSMGRFAAMN